MKNFHFSFFFIFITTLSFAQSTASFEEIDLPLDTFLNNADTLGGYESGDAFFPNVFNPNFGGFWESGWAISTVRDDSTSGFSNLYGNITGSGAGTGVASKTFAIGQQNSIIQINGVSKGKVVSGFYITNTTYAHNSMRDGDDFAKQFGGENGTDSDFFKLDIRKFYNGVLDTNAIEFYLADFRFEADSLDYIVNDWQWVDLSNLGNVDSLHFTLSSSDVGDNGINTPLFFALDHLEMSNLAINIPTDENISTFEENSLSTNSFLNGSEGVNGYESGDVFYPTRFSPDFGGFWAEGWAMSTVRDSSTSGFGNLYGAKTFSGVNSFTYAVGQQNAKIHLKEDAAGKVVFGLYITNTTFAYNSMSDGDDFAKQFGGEDGTDSDFFKVEIQKYSNGQLAPQTVAFYLADFRSDDSSEDYIVNDWQWVDLTSLGNVDSLQFTLSSSDLGDYGINTPLFFAIDNLELTDAISTSNENILLDKNRIAFYPNPAINELIIDFEEKEMKGTIQVFDMLGRPLIQQIFDTKQAKIEVSKLEFGTYILQIVSSEGKRFARTFVKQ
ncbi:MAG: DUF4465 domain-containing protein [Saprospiraceae bacterium]